VNYDLPHVPEDYVHRIGRPGRAGESGQAVSLVSGEDRTLLRDIERLIGKKIEQQIIAGFEPGSGYHSAQPEPQGRRGQQRQNQPRQNQQRQNQPRGQQRQGQQHQGQQRNTSGQRQPFPSPSGRGRE